MGGLEKYTAGELMRSCNSEWSIQKRTRKTDNHSPPKFSRRHHEKNAISTHCVVWSNGSTNLMCHNCARNCKYSTDSNPRSLPGYSTVGGEKVLTYSTARSIVYMPDIVRGLKRKISEFTFEDADAGCDYIMASSEYYNKWLKHPTGRSWEEERVHHRKENPAEYCVTCIEGYAFLACEECSEDIRRTSKGPHAKNIVDISTYWEKEELTKKVANLHI